MAKCIRVVGQPGPVRVSDEDAFQVVERDRAGQYCPKHEFKRPAVEGANYTPFIAKLEGSKVVPVTTLQRHAQRKRYV